MSAKVIKNAPQPKPKGVLVVVGAIDGGERDHRKVTARVIVRDELGQEFYFTATTVPNALSPFYR